MTDWQTLSGKFFHTFCIAGRIDKQGVVLAGIGDGYYVIQLFEWISGGPSIQGTKVVHISAIVEAGWAFYATDKELQESYEYSGRAHGSGKCRCEDG